MPVAIVGAGRSGTSMIARLLSLNGLDIGSSQDLYGANKANPTGYWEHKGFIDLNRRLLDSFDANYQAPPRFAYGWEMDPALDPFYDEAKTLIASSFGEQDFWGWKDPQTSFLIPFWKRVIPDLKIIVCVRNPLDVASSVYGTNRDGIIHSLAHWHLLYLQIFADTEPGERAITFYEDYFDGSLAAFEPVRRLLGLPAIQPGSPLDQELRNFVNPDLKHHHSTLDDVLTNDLMTNPTRRFYIELRTGWTTAVLTQQLNAADDLRSVLYPLATRVLQLSEECHEVKLKNEEYRQILASTVHRAAAAVCSMLIRFPVANAVSRRLRKLRAHPQHANVDGDGQNGLVPASHAGKRRFRLASPPDDAQQGSLDSAVVAGNRNLLTR